MRSRKPLKGGGTLKRSPLAKVSKKYRAKLAQYGKVRRNYLAQKPACEVCRAKIARQIHHIKGRVGALMNDPTNFLACCAECHLWIHQNPSEARQKGFLA